MDTLLELLVREMEWPKRVFLLLPVRAFPIWTNLYIDEVLEGNEITVFGDEFVVFAGDECVAFGNDEFVRLAIGVSTVKFNVRVGDIVGTATDSTGDEIVVFGNEEFVRLAIGVSTVKFNVCVGNIVG